MSHQCSDVRTSLSAHTDGEDAPLSIREVDEHVHACASCTAFAAELSLLDERVETHRRVPIQDRTAAIIAAAAQVEAAAHRTAPTMGQLRGLLWLAAAVQLIVAVTGLAGIGGDHVARDLAIFELAAAGGLGAAAWRPHLAAGLLPMIAVAAGFGLVTMIGDAVVGSISVAAELAHLVLLVATWPLAVLARWSGISGTVARR